MLIYISGFLKEWREMFRIYQGDDAPIPTYIFPCSLRDAAQQFLGMLFSSSKVAAQQF